MLPADREHDLFKAALESCGYKASDSARGRQLGIPLRGRDGSEPDRACRFDHGGIPDIPDERFCRRSVRVERGGDHPAFGRGQGFECALSAVGDRDNDRLSLRAYLVYAVGYCPCRIGGAYAALERIRRHDDLFHMRCSFKRSFYIVYHITRRVSTSHRGIAC